MKNTLIRSLLHGMVKYALAAGVAVALASAEARQMLYCYDFNTIGGGGDEGICTEGMNKGTGTLELQRKEHYINWMPGGAFGSAYAHFSKQAASAVWLGDGSNALCSGLSGFTMSFWVNAPATTASWSDFFGFRFGGTDVRLEYVGTGKPDFRTYGADFILSETGASGNLVGALPSGVWTHCCLVWNFNRAGLDLYVSGALRASITNAAWNCGHTLSQIHIGSWVRDAGADRKYAASTGIDDFALFDFSATPEQVQWLGHHPPALPPEGPGRDMPYRFSFDRVGSGGVNLESYGSAQGAVVEFGKDYRNYVSGGALGTARASYLKENCWCNSVGVSSSGERGLGASIGTGFTFSIWVMGGKPKVAWTDFLGFSVGNRHYRGEWKSTTAPTFTGFGDGSQTGEATLTSGVWNNICYVWNDTSKQVDIYLNGTLTSTYWTYKEPAPSATEVLTCLEVGSTVRDAGGAWRNDNSNRYACGLSVDEAALFNYSFTPDEIAELQLAPPLLPSFTATNLVRTVDASSVWQGFAALWTVSNETAQRLMWPAWEDLRVEASVTIAGADLTLTNDSFVTCRSLAFANGTDATAVRLAIPNVTGAIFKPQALALDAGVELALPFGDSCSGAVTLGANAKLVFDAAAYNGAATVFTAEGGFVLPEGDTDVLAHTTLLNGGADLELVLSADGKQIRLQPISTVPATAVWTGAAGGDLATASNWTCRNAAGETLTDALPTARTVIQVGGSTTLSVSPTDTFACARVELTGNVTLEADCDWSRLGAISVPYGVTIDVNGHTLTVENVSADQKGWTPGTVTTRVAGGVLDFAVAAGQTTTLAGVVRLTGGLKVVKSGEGTLVLAAAGQSYTGGTDVNEGTLVYGTGSNPAGAKNSTVKVAAGATLDMNGILNTTSCIYNYDLAGTVRQFTTADGWNANERCFGDITLSGDATITGTGFYFANPTKTPGIITFNCHTLTLNITNASGDGGYVDFGAWRDEAEGGTFEVTGSGKFEPDAGYGCQRTRFVVKSSSFKLKNSFDVGGFEYGPNSWIQNIGTPILQVYGRYVAGVMRPPIKMHDGSTLDLSAMEGVWSADGIAPSNQGGQTYSEPGRVMFEADTMIIVDLGARLSSGQVVSWATPPIGLAEGTLKFHAPLGANYMVKADERGIFIRRGMMVIIR